MDEPTTDRTEIAALVHAYASLLDAGDLDGVARLFEDATWRSAADGTVLRGVDQVRRVYARVRLYEDRTPRTKHLITNLNVDVSPDGTSATADCSYTVLQGIKPGEPIQVILTGRYLDRFEKTAGRWRFADRLFVADLIGDQSRHFG